MNEEVYGVTPDQPVLMKDLLLIKARIERVQADCDAVVERINKMIGKC